MEQEEIIEPSSSPWALPIVLIKRSDGITRFCLDYRQLNDVTKKGSHPLPRIDNTLGASVGSTLFLTLDLKILDIAQQRWILQIVRIHRLLRKFTVVLFGLCNLPVILERLMEGVLRELQWTAFLVFLDDINVLEKTFNKPLKNLKGVFQRLREANLVNYLGHIVRKEDITVDLEKMKEIQQWPLPRYQHQVMRSFLCLCTYYRCYMPMFVNIVKPLIRSTEEEYNFSWDNDYQKAQN